MIHCYVTKHYDFHDAIYEGVFRQSHKFNVLSVNEINNNSAIVETTHGTFYCESFEDKEANTYMKVFPILAQQNDIVENQDSTQQINGDAEDFIQELSKENSGD